MLFYSYSSPLAMAVSLRTHLIHKLLDEPHRLPRPLHIPILIQIPTDQLQPRIQTHRRSNQTLQVIGAEGNDDFRLPVEVAGLQGLYYLGHGTLEFNTHFGVIVDIGVLGVFLLEVCSY